MNGTAVVRGAYRGIMLISVVRSHGRYLMRVPSGVRANYNPLVRRRAKLTSQSAVFLYYARRYGANRNESTWTVPGFWFAGASDTRRMDGPPYAIRPDCQMFNELLTKQARRRLPSRTEPSTLSELKVALGFNSTATANSSV